MIMENNSYLSSEVLMPVSHGWKLDSMRTTSVMYEDLRSPQENCSQSKEPAFWVQDNTEMSLNKCQKKKPGPEEQFLQRQT